MKQRPAQGMPPMGGPDENRIDINLIAMLLWQSLLTGVAVAVSLGGPGAVFWMIFIVQKKKEREYC